MIHDRDTIHDFVNGRSPGYDAVASWVDTTIYHHGWGHRVDRDDIRQDALSVLLRNFRNFRFEGGSLKSYVQTTCKNCCLQALRKSYKHEHESIEKANMVESGDDPSEYVERLEEYKEFLKVFTRIPSPCKRILVLRYVKSLDYSEIARRLNISEGLARVRAKRCLDRAQKTAGKLRKHSENELRNKGSGN